MIVKKVQTKKGGALKSKALHVRDLCDYIAGPNAGDADEKVEHEGAANMLNVDHAGQVDEMADLAETARRSPQPVQHWIISWRQGEQPTAAQADEAVRIFLDEMGLAEHQCVFALHRNTDNYHLHLAVNRVHPDTERVVTVNGGFDIEVAHRAIARIETAQGWQREERGRYQVLDGGQVQRARTNAPVDRQPTARARDLENKTGEKSAERIVIERGAEVLRRARDWGELHSLLAERGMRFERKGSGAVLWVGDVAIKASTAGRDCSMSALEKRLGDFTSPRGNALARPLAPEPVEPAAAAWKAYVAEREATHSDRTKQREMLRVQQRDRWADLVARHREERGSLSHDWRGKRWQLNGLRSMLAARQAQEKIELKERHQAERGAWRERFPQTPPFEDWLRQRRDPELADQWRFRDRTPARIVGDREDTARPRDIRAFTAEARGWEVLYRRTDERGGGPSFTDRGREIQIHDLRPESVLAALQLSAQKWGTIQVFGSDEYKRLCLDLAAEHGFRIVNPELQNAIAAAREERLRPTPERRFEGTRVRADSVPERSPVRSPLEAYERHLGEVRRQDPGARRDSSRVDALIAVRLRVAGHSREEVERAIRDGAAKQRPVESRNWDEYARRATSHAFGVSGERTFRELAKARDVLLALEDRPRSREPSLDIPRPRGPALGR